MARGTVVWRRGGDVHVTERTNETPKAERKRRRSVWRKREGEGDTRCYGVITLTASLSHFHEAPPPFVTHPNHCDINAGGSNTIRYNMLGGGDTLRDNG